MRSHVGDLDKIHAFWQGVFKVHREYIRMRYPILL